MKYWIAVAALAVAGGVFWLFQSSGDGASEPGDPLVVKGERSSKSVKGIQNARRQRPSVRNGGARTATYIPKIAKEKPTFKIDDDDEAALNQEQRKLIQAIRDALDEEDKDKVMKLVQRLQASDEWPDGIPKSIKMAALEALGWFGSSCLPEIAGFLSDRDDDVLQSALDKYDEALSDPDISDSERSFILVQAAKTVYDSDAIDTMLFELNNMRHSVAVKTIKEIWTDGTDAAKRMLPDNIELYTGEEGIDTPEKLDKWLEENPDDEDDEDFYGGEKPE
jgi:hypothetical protein